METNMRYVSFNITDEMWREINELVEKVEKLDKYRRRTPRSVVMRELIAIGLEEYDV